MGNAKEHKKLIREFEGVRGDLLNARAMQLGVIDDEREAISNGRDYSDEEVRLATVHTRQDMVLLVSFAHVATRRLRQIVWLLTLILICLVLAVW